MIAHDLRGKTFTVVEVFKTKYKLQLLLRDEAGREHRLITEEKAGLGADSGWYSWTEVTFDGDTLLKT